MEPTLEQVAGQISDLSKQVTEQTANLSKQIVGQAGQTADLSKQIVGQGGQLAELSKQLFETKIEMKSHARVNMEELKSEVKLAAEGYGATLEGIERQLSDLNTKFDTKCGNHDLVLTNHNTRITKLEQR